MDGVTGRLVEPDEAPALADSMIAVLSDRTLAHRWGAAGRKQVAEKFGAARMAREVDKIYVNLLHDAHRLEGAQALHLAQPGGVEVALLGAPRPTAARH